MRVNAIKRIIVIDDDRILGVITQESLANIIRTSVLEKTFRPYRALIREHSKPVIGNLGFVLQFAGILMIVPAFISTFMATGLSTLSDPEELPSSFVFYRAYTLWVGGLSFVYLFMALFYPDKKLASMKDILGGGGGGILRFKQLIKTITVIFTVYTIALILAIYYFDAGKLDVIDSISLVFATITGGGFVPVSTFSIVNNIGQLITLMIGMILSALPFAFHYGLFSREIKARQLLSPILGYFSFMAISIILFAILAEPRTVGIQQQQWWLTSGFHVISASTTTGFQLVNLDSISNGAKIILVIVMLIGGMAYSTAGGIKFQFRFQLKYL